MKERLAEIGFYSAKELGIPIATCFVLSNNAGIKPMNIGANYYFSKEIKDYMEIVEGWLTTAKIAEKFNIPRATITTWISRKQVNAKKLKGKYWVDPKSIEERLSRPTKRSTTAVSKVASTAMDNSKFLEMKKLVETYKEEREQWKNEMDSLLAKQRNILEMMKSVWGSSNV